MRFWYVNNDRERICDHASLILFCAVIVAVLIWLFPQQAVFRQQLPADQVDAVSIAYLELLLKTVPEDTSLRINLVRQLIQTGQYKKALMRLNYLLVSYPLEDTNTIDLLQLQILAQLSYSAAISAEKKLAYRATVEQLLARIRGKNFSNSERESIAAIALAVGKPLYAANQYVYLATNDASKKRQWWQKAAKWYLAAGEHEKVARIYVDLAKKNPKPFLQKAIDTYLMLEQRERALELYSEYLSSVGNDVDMLSGAARLAIDVGDKPRAQQYLRHMLANLSDDANAMLQARDLALALGDLRLAVNAAQKYSRLRPADWRQREKLAQIYEWNGMPEQALKQWRKLIDQHPTKKNLQHTRFLATALYDYETVQYILDTTGKRRALAADELSLLVSTYEKRGDPGAGVKYLRSYVQRQPKQRTAWLGMAYLQERMQDLQGALATWRNIDQRFGLSVQESQTLASLLWSLDDTAGALQVLQKAAPNVADDNDTFWRLLAQIAWQEEEDLLAMQALKKAIKSPADVTQQEADILLLIADENSTDLQLQVAQKSWERFRQPHYLIAQMQMAQALKRWDVLELALDEAQGYDYLFAENVQYWLLKAGFAEHNGRTEQAQNAYLQALQLSGDSSDVAQTFLWFLLNSNQPEKLALYLRKWQGLAQQDGSLWSVFAAATSKLGRHAEALRWYSLLVEEDASDLDMLVAYADTLETAGRAPAAWRLRKHVYNKMMQQQVSTSVTGDLLTNQLNLTYSLGGYRAAYAHLQQTRGQRGVQQWLPQHTDQLIAQGDADVVNFWRMWLQQHEQRDLPVLQRMALAQHNYDRDAMQGLLQRAEITPSIHANTLQRLGWNSQALAVGLEALQPSAGDQQGLRELTAQLGSERPSGWRVDWRSDQLGGIDLQGPELSWAQNFDNWHSQLELQNASYSSDNLVDLSGIGDETVLQWRWLHDTRHGNWSVKPLASWRDDQSIYGLQGQLERRWDSRLSTTVAAAWQDLPTVTPLLRAFGVYDHIDGSVNYAFSARDSITANIGLNRFQARVGGDTFARGYDAGISYSHRINFADPEWAITAGVEWQKNSLDARFPADITSRLRDANTSPDTILPEDYGQVFIGTTLQRGDLHALNARTPSPRYLFNTAVAYQWPLSQVSFAVSFGLGWRIMGNDELALTYGYNSKPLGGQGDAAQDIRLSYSYRFGR
ncbi:MAG: tetratricopeptide repeat protein [Pseudomonadales bacterium]